LQTGFLSTKDCKLSKSLLEDSINICVEDGAGRGWFPLEEILEKTKENKMTRQYTWN
jgi:hypothetical protein